MEQERYYARGQKGYPRRLMAYPDMPSGLYVRGNLPEDEKPGVAIVGARTCTPYGRAQAAYFAQVLSQNGVAIISGLAYGIDAAAQEGALKGCGKTYAVLGCGTDVCYPKQHAALRQSILQDGGGVISEYPAGSPPLSWHFPIRNRIISALSDLVLIIEAKEKSGSLITADYALEQGKTVFAVPGRISDPNSYGCNRLIAQGASLALSPEDLLEELGISKQKSKKKENKLPSYGGDTKKVLDALDSDRQSLSELARKTGLAIGTLSGILLALQIDGAAKEGPQGYYQRV